jgi:integrase
MTTDKNAFSFTHSRLESIKPPKSGRDSYRDTKVAGLYFVITANASKSFYFVKRIERQPRRIRIGGFPDITIDEARKEAQRFNGEIAKGENPHTTRRNKTNVPTLKELFDYWLTTHAKIHKKSWEADVRLFNKYCTSLHNKQLTQLTKSDIVKWHQQLGEKHGQYMANRVYALVRSLFHVGDELGYTGTNPCVGVRMFPEKSRERFLLPDELKRFRDAVMEETPLYRDLIFMLLFTGQRKKNVCKMQWKDLDLERGLWYVAGEQLKNGSPLVVVLSTNALAILNERFNASDKHEHWVFPSGAVRGAGYVFNPQKAWERVRERAGLTDVRIHDLRRTLGSWQALVGASLQIIGKSLGHKSMRSTEIYARLTTDPVRESVEKATQEMASHWTEQPDTSEDTEIIDV